MESLHFVLSVSLALPLEAPADLDMASAVERVGLRLHFQGPPNCHGLVRSMTFTALPNPGNSSRRQPSVESSCWSGCLKGARSQRSWLCRQTTACPLAPAPRSLDGLGMTTWVGLMPSGVWITGWAGGCQVVGRDRRGRGRCGVRLYAGVAPGGVPPGAVCRRNPTRSAPVLSGTPARSAPASSSTLPKPPRVFRWILTSAATASRLRR